MSYLLDLHAQIPKRLSNFIDDGICDVVWSPDSQKLVFQKGCAALETGSSPSLYIINRDGSDLMNLVDPNTFPFKVAVVDSFQPEWSLQGENIVFGVVIVAESGNLERSLFMVKKDGSAITRLSSQGDHPLYWAWSPTENKLAVQDQNKGIIIVDPYGGQSELVYASCAHPTGLAWSPDGKALAFSDCGKVYILDLNTRQTRKITGSLDEEVTLISEQWVKIPKNIVH